MGDQHAAITGELRALNDQVEQAIHQRLRRMPTSLEDLHELVRDLAASQIELERQAHRSRAGELRYQRLLEAVTSYTYSVTLDDGMPISTQHSPGCLHTTGYVPDEYASDRDLWLTMVPPEDWTLVLEQAGAACEGTAKGPIEHRIRHKDGSTRWVKSTVVPYRDEAGSVVRYDGVVEDITERKLARIELETDLQIQKTLKTILEISLEPIPLEDMLGQVLLTLISVPFIALESKGSIFLADDESESLVMKAQYGLSPDLLAICRVVPFGCCLCGRAAAQREVALSDCLDGRHVRPYSGIAPHGHYCVPIVSNGRTLGVLNLYVRNGHEPKETEELFLRSVADTLAGAIVRSTTADSLRHTQAEFLAAERIQQHLLPRSSPVLPGYDIHGVLIPAYFAAGDYFDYLKMPDDTLGLVIGDVTGHGVSSGLFAASVQARIKTLAGIRLGIDQIMRQVNDALVRESTDDLFVTSILARFDMQSHTLSYVNAGHPSGYVIAADGTIKSVLQSTAIPLAIQEDELFSISGSVPLDPGDAVVFLTDGITEARSRHNELFGTKRANDVLATACHENAQGTIDALLAAVCKFTEDTRQNDDITAVVVKRLA